MAETAESSSVSENFREVASSLDEKNEEFIEPPKKKLKTDDGCLQPEDKLERRLGGILCCAVCLDLPKAAVYQCINGHLMCAGCFTHLLADARLKDETATCPNCRTEISKTLCSRNLAVEKAVCELPTECQYCNRELPRSALERHEKELCIERLTNCHYVRIGCLWSGPHHELKNHEQNCMHPNKSGSDVMEVLKVLDSKHQEEMKLYCNIFNLLSFEKITFNDLQFRPYRSDEFIHRLFYETSRFTAFNNQWVVKSHVNDNQRDPTLSCERALNYQVVLKSKVTSSMGMHYLVLPGPFGDMKVNAKLYHFEFSNEDYESPNRELPIINSVECNKLLSARTINFRLIMFHDQK